MRKCGRGMIGLLCMALGCAIILGLLLPHWVWMTCIGLILIGCGLILFL